MLKSAKILRTIAAAACIALLLLLALGCFDIYIDGNSPQNLDERGVHLAPVFSAESISSRFEVLAPMLIVCLVVIIGACVALRFVGNGKGGAEKEPRKCDMNIKTERPKLLLAVRLGLPILAAVFIVLGVMNGGARDVLVKAINICTECIGLG